MSRILIYGANGYTGALIAEESARRGLKPILAGRNRDALEVLAQRLKVTRRVFELRDHTEVLRNLEGAGLLASEVEPSISGPPRRYYRITKPGREALREWVAAWTATRDSVDNVLQGGV